MYVCVWSGGWEGGRGLEAGSLLPRVGSVWNSDGSGLHYKCLYPLQHLAWPNSYYLIASSRSARAFLTLLKTKLNLHYTQGSPVPLFFPCSCWQLLFCFLSAFWCFGDFKGVLWLFVLLWLAYFHLAWYVSFSWQWHWLFEEVRLVFIMILILNIFVLFFNGVLKTGFLCITGLIVLELTWPG